jgi:hypothetical protein
MRHFSTWGARYPFHDGGLRIPARCQDTTIRPVAWSQVKSQDRPAARYSVGLFLAGAKAGAGILAAILQ